MGPRLSGPRKRPPELGVGRKSTQAPGTGDIVFPEGAEAGEQETTAWVTPARGFGAACRGPPSELQSKEALMPIFSQEPNSGPGGL